MAKPVLIYGATGYTGGLVAEEAQAKGLPAILAGRNATRLAQLGSQSGYETQAFDLADRSALDASLADAGAVLHLAGPFSATWRPMAEACLRAGVHYMDITGEIAVFEALAARDKEATERGVVMMPGVGFDVVPSDCLAAYVHERMPEANRLRLAIAMPPVASRGTMKTMIEGLPHGTASRQNGRIVTERAGARYRYYDFGQGPVRCVGISWGDVSTAYRTTGIPNIETYFEESRDIARLVGMARRFGSVLGWRPVQSLLKAAAGRGPEGPTAEQRARYEVKLMGEGEDAAGGRFTARLRTPEAYALTARTAVAAATRVLAGEVEPGFRTPAEAFGADFILSFDGTHRDDVNI